MTKELLMKYISFQNQNEKDEAEQYLKMKGISFHKKIMTHLGFDFNDLDKTIEWNRISSLLRYDKRLRDKIYIYLATLEEYIRAFISNKYDDFPNQDFWLESKIGKKSIKDKILSGMLVSNVLESIDFGELILQVYNLPEQDILLLFDNNESINSNLKAVRVFRNAVSHHVFLHGHELLNCRVNGVTNNSLEFNISNLRQLLPIEYRCGKNGKGGITEDINGCMLKYKSKDANSRFIRENMTLEERDIVKLI